MKDIFKILNYIFAYKRQVSLSIFFNILFVFSGLFSVAAIIPFLRVVFEPDELVLEKPTLRFDMDYFTEYANYSLAPILQNPEQGPTTALLLICIAIITLTFIKSATRYMAMYFMAPVRNGVMNDLRNKIFQKITALPLSYFTNEKKGDLMARMSNDVHEVEVSVISTFEILFKDPLIVIVHLIALITMNWQLTMFALVMLPISGAIIGRIGKRLRQNAVKGQNRLGILLSILEETISGLRIIKAFGTEEKMNQHFKNTNGLYTQIMNKIFRRRSLAGPLSEFLGTIVMVVIVWFGGKLVLNSTQDTNFNAESLMGYLLIFYMIINPSKNFTTAYYSIQKGLASIERINAVLNAPIIIEEKKDATEIKNFSDKIEFRNVSFAYDKEHVLKNINLSIEKGKTIALVGQSGSGKSTLVDLIPRLINLEEGELLIDGHSVNDLKIKDLRKLVGVVTQESILFNNTVFNNISFGDNHAKEPDVIQAAKVANAHEFIEKMEQGYYTNIGERGSKLSGGQRQRMTIARAIYKNPPILILDEATSALDTESEQLVQEAISSLMKNRTSIVIAHRLSTIQDADEIIVMKEGGIAERGTHDELVNMNGVYKHLVDLQDFH